MQVTLSVLPFFFVWSLDSHLEPVEKINLPLSLQDHLLIQVLYRYYFFAMFVSMPVNTLLGNSISSELVQHRESVPTSLVLSGTTR